MEKQTIPQFYTNKIIFITGGSGFIGKVLIEKLLRSCPDLKNIYLLMREKKGQDPEERIKSITNLPLFDVVKSQDPESLTKIELIKGDVKDLGLGLSPEDRKKLIDEVNIVFHSAASVRLDGSLTDVVLLNTRGTREVVALALEMKKLEVFVHVSTTYCNCDKKVVEEKLYPPHADWKKTIEVAENVDRHTLDVLTAKYIQPLPNTYTFAKSMSEHVVYDMCNGKIPAVIYRPSVVVATALEPFPGWLENFNGPMSLLIAGGKGVQSVVACDPYVLVDYVPVDLTVKAMIAASWKQATIKDVTLKLSPEFYNGANFDNFVVTFKELCEKGAILLEEVPFNDIIRYPSEHLTKCYYNFLVKFFMYDFLLAVICDGLLMLSGRKPMLIKIQRKIYIAEIALRYFMHNQWQFINDKCAGLPKELLSSDIDSFSYKELDVDIFDYLRSGILGTQKYLLKEDINLDRAKVKLFRMWILSKIVNFLWYLGLLWLVFVKLDVTSTIVNKWNNFTLYLTD